MSCATFFSHLADKTRVKVKLIAAHPARAWHTAAERCQPIS
jgi:hypothetical protein